MRSSFCCLSLAFALGMVWTAPALAAPITSGTGPGGVSLTNGTDTLELWLRSDAGVFEDTAGTDAAESLDSVARWNDQSGNAHHAIQNTGANRPQFETGGATNSRPTLNFSGSHTLPIGAYTMTGGETAFIVGLMGDGGLRSFLADPVVNRGYTYGHDGVANNPGFLFSSASFSFANTWRVNGASTQNFGVSNYGIATGTNNPFTGALANFSVGSTHGGASNHLGETAEIIIFNSGVNTARRILVENYLSSKYNLAINTGSGGTDVYVGDTGPNGNFDHSVFGVGRVGGVQHLDADGAGPGSGVGSNGFGIEVVSLTDNEWLLAGNNGNTSSTMSVDINGVKRWNRTWFVDKTSVDGIDATLTFDFSDAGITLPTLQVDETFQLLYAAPGSNIFTSLGIAPQVNGDAYSFFVPNSVLLDGVYTLGITQVPEPTAFALLGLGTLGLVASSRRRRMGSNR